MKRWFVFLTLFISSAAHAQFLKSTAYDSRVQLELGNYSSPNDFSGIGFSSSIVNTIGLGLERKITKHIGIKADIQRWRTFQSQYYWHGDPFGKRFLNYDEPIGELIGRAGYFMADIGPTISFKHRHGEISGYAAFSFARGKDDFVTGYGGNFAGDIVLFDDWKTKTHLGGACELGYNYHLAKNRINIGPSLNARYYPGQFSQYTLKLNMGYNFHVR